MLNMHPNRQFLAHFIVHMPLFDFTLLVSCSAFLCIVIEGGAKEPSFSVLQIYSEGRILSFPCVFTGWTWWYYWCIGGITGALVVLLVHLVVLLVHWWYYWCIGGITGALVVLLVHWWYYWCIGGITGALVVLLVHWWYYWCIGGITGALLCTLDFLHPRHSTAQVHQNFLGECWSLPTMTPPPSPFARTAHSPPKGWGGMNVPRVLADHAVAPFYRALTNMFNGQMRWQHVPLPH